MAHIRDRIKKEDVSNRAGMENRKKKIWERLEGEEDMVIRYAGIIGNRIWRGNLKAEEIWRNVT